MWERGGDTQVEEDSVKRRWALPFWTSAETKGNEQYLQYETLHRSLNNKNILIGYGFFPQHALQELERVTAQRAQVEKEKKTMESSLRDSRIERDSLRYPNTLSFFFK